MNVNCQVIEKYLESNFTAIRENGAKTEYVIVSPFFSGSGFKLYISKSNGKWIDFRGQGDGDYQGDFDKFVSMYEKTPRDLARSKLLSIGMDLGIDVFDVPDNMVYQTIAKQPVNIPYGLIPAELNPISFSYLKRRQLNEHTIKHYSLMYNTSNNSILIPFVHNNIFVYYIERKLSGAFRWVNPVSDDIHYSKKDIFFGEQSVVDPNEIVFICEGCFDAMTIHQWGFQSLSLNGSIITSEQLTFLKINNIKKIALCLDFDNTGLDATYTIAENIISKVQAEVMINHSSSFLEDIKEKKSGDKIDWNELTIDDFYDFISGMYRYDRMSEIMYNLSNIK